MQCWTFGQYLKDENLAAFSFFYIRWIKSTAVTVFIRSFFYLFLILPSILKSIILCLQPVVRAPRQFNTLHIPKELQKALPFKSKIKQQRARGKTPRDLKRTPVVREPHEKKVSTAWAQRDQSVHCAASVDLNLLCLTCGCVHLTVFRWQLCSMLWVQSTTTRPRKSTRRSTPNTRSSCGRRRSRRRPRWRGTRRHGKNCTASWARWTRKSRSPAWRGRRRTTKWLVLLISRLNC